MHGAGLSSLVRTWLVLSRAVCVRFSARSPQSTVAIIIAPSRGCRGGVVCDYPPAAARTSPSTTSSLGGEAVAAKGSSVLVASWLGFLCGDQAGGGDENIIDSYLPSDA